MRDPNSQSWSKLDRKATAISLLVVIGVRADGQKMLLAIKSVGSESAEAWRAVLDDDLIRRGLRRPEFLIVDGAAGLDKAIAAVWDGVPVQRCTVHYADLRIMPTNGWMPAPGGGDRCVGVGIIRASRKARRFSLTTRDTSSIGRDASM